MLQWPQAITFRGDPFLDAVEELLRMAADLHRGLGADVLWPVGGGRAVGRQEARREAPALCGREQPASPLPMMAMPPALGAKMRLLRAAAACCASLHGLAAKAWQPLTGRPPEVQPPWGPTIACATCATRA